MPADLGKTGPEPTWFFRREVDQKVLAFGEAEAHSLLRERNNWMRRDFTMLGSSDGREYYRVIQAAQADAAEKRSQLAAAKSDAARYRQTEDRLRFEELRGADDPQVAKVVGILAELDARIAASEAELADWDRAVIDRAFAAELALATGNMAAPRNMSVFTPKESDREEILAQMPKQRTR